MEYTIWLFISAGVPLIYLFLKYGDLLLKYRFTLVLVVLLSLLIHGAWDIYAVSTNIWSFPAGTNLGIYIVNLPIEEWLYTTLVPLFGACITVVVKYKFNRYAS
ncbi:lycopene cyclase domain-containing protein [Candidatus Woesebacteria bacterium]|nr:lycopene cyclase domain-containing protein [Candidatus Woesebacteria bacterium]